MKVLVTGANGQLGFDVMKELKNRGKEAIATGTSRVPRERLAGLSEVTYVRVDITRENEVKRVFERERPDAVIHCASWTDVDAAEKDENITKVRQINRDGTEYIAAECQRFDCKMIYISTDYVFNGFGEEPFNPDDSDCLPMNIYGLTKREGELAVMRLVKKAFVVRISWAFGINGKNFVNTMLELSKVNDSIFVVNDQFGAPTYTKDLARLLVDMIETGKYGVYHVTNEGGYVSWFDLAVETMKQSGSPAKIVPVSSKEYDTMVKKGQGQKKAKRPKNSRLNTGKLKECGFQPLPDWKDAVGRYLNERKAEENN